MIGLDLSDKSVKIAEIADEKYPVLNNLCWAPISEELIRGGVVQDVALVTDALKKAMNSCSAGAIKKGNVVASIPEVQSFVRVLQVPEMSQGEMDEAVQWAVRRHIPFDLEGVYIDWEDLNIETSQKNKSILVGAVQKNVVDPLMSVLDNTGFNVVALELEAQAVLRCLLPKNTSEARDIRGILVVDLGATTTNVVLFDQGVMRFTTNVQYGGDDITRHLSEKLNINMGEAMQLKERVGLGFDNGEEQASKIMREATLKLINMINRAVQEMTVQLPPDQRVKGILLTGGSANLVGIIELFNSVFTDVTVQLGNPWTNLEKGETNTGTNISVGDAIHFTTAIGLALRDKAY